MRNSIDINQGLNEEQVKMRIEEGKVNIDTSVPTKTIPCIIRDNLFTLFNLLNFILALAVFIVGSYKNLFFMGIVICNTIISTFQEIRSKLVVDKLSILANNKVNAIRNGNIQKIAIEEVVLDDILFLKPGNQIVADCIIKEGSVEVNESFITGESDSIHYQQGDMLKSGSFIVVGTCKAQVEHVGIDNYTHVISKDAKYVKPMNSILMNSLNKIIKIVSIAIIPMGILLFMNQYQLDNNMTRAVLSTVAALIGMIPEGLVLLTSTVLAVSVIRLSRLQVLVQELYCIEMLARVDTICLDKTGTITDGKMKVIEVVPLEKCDIERIMGNFIHQMDNENATMEALTNYFKVREDYEVIEKTAFSSKYKYSGVSFKEGNYILGAPEFVYEKKIKEIEEKQKENRVILLCEKSKTTKPIAYIVLEDTIRETAGKTFAYFKEQGVDIKIISGDNINTVCSIAKKAGLENIKGIDVSKLNEEQLERAVLENNIFGRVNPIQKKQMVEMLQKNGHFVAMTGDGVNDVLALKQADCSIAVATGSDAARNVSQLVLLNSDFDSLPKVVKEGRRTINNIERSATLFLAKTCYAFLLAFLFIFINASYPFQPIQLTLTNFFTIGVPSFILALEPNNERIKGNFLFNVFSRSLPTALTIVINIMAIALLGKVFFFEGSQISTLCVIMTGFTGFLLLFKLSMPFTKWRLGLIILLICGFITSIFGFREFFSLTLLHIPSFIMMVALVTFSTIIFNLMSLLVDKLIKKHPKLFS